MKRRANGILWAGFLVVLAALLSYIPLFARFPVTRDFPWANLLLFGVGLVLMTVGLRRVYRQPGLYRGKIAGPILLSAGLLLLGFFCLASFYFARLLPASTGAPRVGQEAPDFTLPDQDGSPVSLADLLRVAPDGSGRANGALLIFYRGYW